LAAAVGAQFRRIQFTPDLLPADLLGTEIYNPRTSEFTFRPGPIFTQILLADEINRAPAKVQSALLEAMQERQVTLASQTFPLPEPFLVLATQNPIEHEGTYPLPEAQVDRFFLKILVSYPDRDDERRILRQYGVATPASVDGINAVVAAPQIAVLRQAVDAVYIDSKLEEYILDVVRATRDPREFGLAIGEFLQMGASPRATLSLALASRAIALLEGRDYVLPQDVKAIGPDVLRHRILLTFEAEAQDRTPDQVLHDLFASLKVP
jgi:MoxR-like ATPase